jgi:hypothetical protein
MTNEATKPEAGTELGGRVDAFVMRDYSELHDRFTEIAASQIHYFDRVDGVDLSRATADEVRNLSDGWILRYRSDAMFNARVRSMVSQLMAVVTDA